MHRMFVAHLDADDWLQLRRRKSHGQMHEVHFDHKFPCSRGGFDVNHLFNTETMSGVVGDLSPEQEQVWISQF